MIRHTIKEVLIMTYYGGSFIQRYSFSDGSIVFELEIVGFIRLIAVTLSNGYSCFLLEINGRIRIRSDDFMGIYR